MAIVNGDFRDWGGAPANSTQLATGWEIFSAKETLVPEKCGEGQSDPTTHDGSYCQGWSGERDDGIFQIIKVKPVTYYTITFWTRFAGPGGGMLKNWDYYDDALHTEVTGKKGNVYCCVGGSAIPWVKLNAYFTTDKEEHEVTFKCYQMKKGKYYLADVAISEGVPENVTVSNSYHHKIYYPEVAPRFTEWVRLAKLANDDLVLSFHELVGNGKSTALPPLYDGWFTDKALENRRKYGAEHKRRMLTSTDKGRTWKSLESRAGAGSVSSDGREVQWNSSYDGQRLLQVGKDGIYSSTNCVTWRKEAPLDLNQTTYFTGYEGDVLELRDGTFVVYYVGCKKLDVDAVIEIPIDEKKTCIVKDKLWGGVDYNERSSSSKNSYTIKERMCSGAAYISSDRGKTWMEIVVAPYYVSKKNDDYMSFTEISAVETNAGDVLFLMRTEVPWPEMKWGKEDSYHQVTLRRKGNEWVPGEIKKTPLEPVLFLGHPCLLKLKSGILVAGGSGHQYIFSADDGKTWQARNLSFGLRRVHYIRMVEVEDGRVLAAGHMGADWPYPPFEDQWINGTFFDVKKC